MKIMGKFLFTVLLSTARHSAVHSFTLQASTVGRGRILHTVIGNNRSSIRVTVRRMASTEVDVTELERLIAAKGDDIRRMKADGNDKAALTPHVVELLALKAKLSGIEAPKQEAPKHESKKNKVNGEKIASKPEMEIPESELRQARLEKVKAMREAGVEPYEYTYNPNRTAEELRKEYEGRLENGEEDYAADVIVAGRILAKRVFGKLAFFTLQDETGKIQLYLEKSRLGDSFKVRR